MPEQFTEDELDTIWSEFGGLAPQLFPKYYTMGPVPFTLNGAPSGAVGATATLSKAISNFPQIMYGVRVSNVYQLPTSPTALDLQKLDAYHRWLDGEQTIGINLSQQNVTAQPMLQVQLTGRGDSVWHPFSAPYPMAGGNSINLEIRRITGYPDFDQSEAVEPTVFATLLVAEFKATRSTTSVKRVLGRR